METTESAYPVRFDIDYPQEPRNRLTLAFRLILAIPILGVIAATDAAGSLSGTTESSATLGGPLGLLLAGDVERAERNGG